MKLILPYLSSLSFALQSQTIVEQISPDEVIYPWPHVSWPQLEITMGYELDA